MALQIIFENNEILVINKPSGLVVNKSKTINEKTLQDELGKYLKIKGLGIGDRAGIVHRLDRETSGILLIAKTQRVFKFLQKQFKERKIKKEYTALVHGKVQDTIGRISSNISRIGKFGKFGVDNIGREALTEYEVLWSYKFNNDKFNKILDKNRFTKPKIKYLRSYASGYALLKVKPRTGRTHQVRVHLKSIGHPVVCDNIYTPSKLLKFDKLWCRRLFLHASYIEFKIFERSTSFNFKADLPLDLKNCLKNLTTDN
ncbi:hypothetical protein A2164_04310 [Candidatus Curtissbacteria bacterium RBG_13_35_7]|uniref:Pseudouridine synthase RsuA/RluA-like domain-containing protein n=1 Tax=Candidatus Curtissbacteria bacterium RBG_13_35_7 TaxID=1797705 RepID=A0A1F5G601_9BACT|nr:MAG: hypothetical protein A2164_04310 [Candidatus Curtissbacteria bacterium RBG_13_35_7]